MSSAREARILLVEDNPGDVRLTREALDSTPEPKRVYVVADGAEALDFLFRRGAWAGAPAVDLVLLDLNLPRVRGEEVLAAVRAEPSLQALPVVVFSSSDADRDVRRSYELHANAFVSKPMDYADFHSAVRSMEQFWLSTAELPGH